MGAAWSYCAECGEGLPKCTAAEAARNKMACPGCGTELQANVTLDEALNDIQQRIAALEAKLRGDAPC